MNRHFSDAWYHLNRAVEHTRLGLDAELAPLRERAREMTGPEPEPTRLEKLKRDLSDVELSEEEARQAVREARQRLREYRESETRRRPSAR